MKIKIIFCILSALLLTLSFPTFNLEWLAWVGFVPLLFALKGISPKGAFWLAYLCGVIFFIGTIYWLVYVTLVGFILLILYLALYFGIFGFLYNLYNRYGVRQSTLFVIPSIWVSLEWLRGQLLTGFGWALLGYSQFLNLPVIQLADVTGVWGISFLVMMVNVAIFDTAKTLNTAKTLTLKRKNLCGLAVSPQSSQRKFSDFAICVLADILRFGGVIFIFIIVLIYGYHKLNQTPSTENRSPIRVSVIQGNIPQEQKWDEEYEEFIMERYEALTIQASEDRPKLIIWPETALPGFLEDEPALTSRVTGFVKDIGIPLLIGTPYLKDSNVYNSAVFLSAQGKLINRYDKLHLVPFGEYIPFENLFPRIGRLVEIGDFSPGKDYTVFSFPPEADQPLAEYTRHITPTMYHFSVLICFEDIFPDLVRRFVKNGADFLVNITNDAWFGRTSSPYQHAQASVFRAVENRVSVIRATNTGLSCFIDSSGKIYQTLRDKKGNEIFVEGFKTASVSISRGSSFYNRYGDLFIIICGCISIYGIIKIWQKWFMRKRPVPSEVEG